MKTVFKSFKSQLKISENNFLGAGKKYNFKLKAGKNAFFTLIDFNQKGRNSFFWEAWSLCTGKSIKNNLAVKKWYTQLCIRLNQSLRITFRIYTDEKPPFLKGAWHLGSLTLQQNKYGFDNFF